MKANKKKRMNLTQFLDGMAKIIIIPCLVLEVFLFTLCASNTRPLVTAMTIITLLLYAVFIEISKRLDEKVNWIALCAICTMNKEEFILKNKPISDLVKKVLFGRLLMVPILALYTSILYFSRDAYINATACAAILMIIFIYFVFNVLWSLLLIEHKISIGMMEKNET